MSNAGQSWGRYPHTTQQILTVADRHQPLQATIAPCLPYGNGRSYGDSCLNDGGVLLHTRGLDRFIAFDPATGIICCEAGVLFAEILDISVPQGWFLPVTPGTRYVTVGGAIANDVHGKNHHRAGTIGHYVTELELLRSNGQRLRCSEKQNATWLAATVGGLGLTGLITYATLQLRRIKGPWLAVENHRLHNLTDFFSLSAESDRDYEYIVAWVDCAAKGRKLGRGLLSRANHAPACPEEQPRKPSRRLRVPVAPPISLINPFSLRAFNALYYHRQRKDVVHAVSHYEPFFYPLDAVGDWNRLYGPRGFLQYQCVVPPDVAKDTIPELLRIISAHGEGSFLAVLKQFGKRPSIGLLSFARPGVTLALDFPHRGKSTFDLLDQLDNIVTAARGAVYPAKDAHMSGPSFRQYFPQWEIFRTFVDPGFSSSFWRRVME
jgi:FAD/FMN-containing dehydrogenase